jgi:tRNA (guanine-N7-)-methyltransferase
LEHFAENEVAEIWITFPDPQPQDSREKKRLTNPKFLEKYRSILQDSGIMHLKTDNDGFFAYTMEQIGLQELPVLKHTTDLYRSDLVDPVLSIKTYYENKYLSVDKNINYVQWKLNKIS